MTGVDSSRGEGEPTADGPRFVCDVMLGKLATVLRMSGHDTAYAFDRDAETDGAVLEIARQEDRTILTRDRQLAERAEAADDLDVVLVNSREWPDPAAELARAGVEVTLDEPARCSTCNGRLEIVTDSGPGDRPDYAPGPDDGEPVWRCVDCGQHFWRGSHWDDVAARLARATANESNESGESSESIDG